MLNNNKKQETQFFGTKCGNANSIAAGYATETTNYGEIATGILNKSTKGDNPNSPEGVVGDSKATLFSVGCGTKEERKNALEVKGDGSVIISGKDGSDVNINEDIKYLKDRSVVLDTKGRVLIPYMNYVTPLSIRRTNVRDYMYVTFYDELEDNTVPQYIYDKTTNEVIKVIENKNNAIEYELGDFFNTEEPLNLSHTLYLDNEKTGNISDLEELTIKESDIFEGIPYVCEDDTLDDDEAPQYIYDATDKKWITVNESYYLSSCDFFNTEKPLDLSHTLFYVDGENVIDYDRTSGQYAVALGNKAKATGYGATALGSVSQAMGYHSTALGNISQAMGQYSTALGYFAKITNDRATALGSSSQATGDCSIAIGYNARSLNRWTTALGYNAQATGYGATALGYQADVSKSYAIAIGKNAKNNKSIFSVGFDGVNGIDMDEDNYGLYLKGFGGYTGTNLTVNNEAGEEVLNPDIKSVQEIINEKADLTPIVTSTDATISLQPNKKYEITAGDTLMLTFTEPSDKTHKNEYLFSINTGSSVSTITFPIEIIWDVEPVIAANKHYEINVQYSQGKYWGTVHTWNIPS